MPTVLRFRTPARSAASELAFPSWAPPEVIARWREEARAVAQRPQSLKRQRLIASSGTGDVSTDVRHADLRGVPGLLERLLTDALMARVWERLTRAGNYGAGEGIPYTVLFTAQVIRAWRGPHGEERWTAAKRRYWARKVAAVCAELAHLLRGTGADDYLWRMYFQGAPALERAEWHPGQVSDALRSIAALNEHLLVKSTLGRPGDAQHARRAYFVRSLGAWLQAAFDAPCARLLADTAAVALEDASIEATTVSRLIRNRGTTRPENGA